ncbi:hypothetical protein E2C01_004065 [Portunus trituberculatus]|uniref:Uncharacterized protein n=1 Tax=Portunus trituberculatus TaxID=210409 RepID=A0A5B7CRF3_PORTR|nr:hypothetical protein [Portunus trituberculatus]
MCTTVMEICFLPLRIHSSLMSDSITRQRNQPLASLTTYRGGLPFSLPIMDPTALVSTPATSRSAARWPPPLNYRATESFDATAFPASVRQLAQMMTRRDL